MATPAAPKPTLRATHAKHSPDRRPDRRIQRTRALLRDALMSLILEKGYESITIQDIADRANVARTTFYLHFSDKDDLLFNGMRDIYDDLIAGVRTHSLSDALDSPADATDFRHVLENADFYRIMLGWCDSWVRPGAAPRIPLELFGYLCAGMLISSVSWWLRDGNEQKYTPEQMAQFMQDFTLFGGLWALGWREKSEPSA
jgi:AcrR family transcriptional regulator